MSKVNLILMVGGSLTTVDHNPRPAIRFLVTPSKLRPTAVVASIKLSIR